MIFPARRLLFLRLLNLFLALRDRLLENLDTFLLRRWQLHCLLPAFQDIHIPFDNWRPKVLLGQERTELRHVPEHGEVVILLHVGEVLPASLDGLA